MSPHQFPLPADIYPFEIDLESLSREIVAKYLWIEADNIALDPKQHKDDKEKSQFISEVLAALPIPPNQSQHVGSIYRQIVCCFEKVWEQRRLHRLPEDFPYSAWQDRLRALQFQGEITHFTFFKDQFTGEVFGGSPDIWKRPESAEYPAKRLFRGTAFQDYPDTIPNDDARHIATLANMHYWLLLMLLDASYRDQDRAPRYKAVDGMT